MITITKLRHVKSFLNMHLILYLSSINQIHQKKNMKSKLSTMVNTLNYVVLVKLAAIKNSKKVQTLGTSLLHNILRDVEQLKMSINQIRLLNLILNLKLLKIVKLAAKSQILSQKMTLMALYTSQ